MSEEVEFLYTTRLRRQSMDADFQSRLAAALVRDVQRENTDENTDEVNNLLGNDEEEEYVPEDDASDVEDE